MKEIPDDEFQMLLACLAQYNALLKFGVKNWEHYQDAMKSLEETDEE